MKKQWFVVLVAMVLLLSVCLLAACEGDTPGEGDASIGDDTPGEGDTSVGDNTLGEDDGETTEGLAYRLKEDGTYAVTGIGAVTDDTIKIPSAYQGKSVSEIADFAFSGCTGLTSITIPESVTSIGNSAFAGCSAALASITVDAGNSTYYSSNNCLIETKSKTLVLGCKNSVIPSDVTSIGYGAFYGCTGLTSVTIPPSVTSIGYNAFYGCTNLTYNEYGNAYYLGNASRPYLWLAKAKDKSITSCKIHESAKGILNDAFRGCTNITEATMPTNAISDIPQDKLKTVVLNGGTSIAQYAFDNCTSLESITIPSSVTNIGNCAFRSCTGLTSVTISEGVTSIGNYAFYGCTGLTSITIPLSVTSIGDGAFEGCTGLTSITIPESVTTIGDLAFAGCTGLTSVTIPSSVTSIGSAAFSYCMGLTSITIPSSVTSIGVFAFYGCTSLTSVTFMNTTGWYITTSSSGTSGTSVTVTDAVQNATYLKDTYSDYFWRRNG